MKKLSKLLAAALVLVTMLTLIPVPAQAADYINVASVASTYGISSGSTAYNALSLINTKYASQLTTSQKQGIVVFMFEGAGNDLSASKRMGAMCVVVKNGSVAYLNRNSTTLPDYPFSPSRNDGTAMPTVKAGIHSFTTCNHSGSYAALNITNAPVVRFNSSTSHYDSVSYDINVHRRTTDSIAGASASWVNSAGCFLVGVSGTSSSGEYARFIQAVGIVGSGAAGNAKYSYSKSGKIVVDRSFAGSYMASIGYPSSALGALGAVDESQPPTQASISTDKDSYSTSEVVTFNMSGNGTTNTLWVYRVDGQWENYYQNAGSSFTLQFGWEGRYKALMETWNSKGSKISNTVYFQIGKPSYATIKASKNTYTTDETATFTLDSDGGSNTVWFYYPDGSYEYIQNLTTTCTKKFTKTGKIEALVEAWNGVGSFCSERISFTVTQGSGTTTTKPTTTPTTTTTTSDQPTSATISANKSTVKVEENITLSFSGNGKTNTLWVYFPDGTSRYYQNAGTSRTMSFANPGKYEALVETWNAAGNKSFISKRISFTVVPADAPTKAKISTNKSSYTTGENVVFNFDTDGVANDLWIYNPDGTSKAYQGVGATKTLSFTTPGTYQALVQTWNDAATAEVMSQRITFTVTAPTTATTTKATTATTTKATTATTTKATTATTTKATTGSTTTIAPTVVSTKPTAGTTKPSTVTTNPTVPTTQPTTAKLDPTTEPMTQPTTQEVPSTTKAQATSADNGTMDNEQSLNGAIIWLIVAALVMLVLSVGMSVILLTKYKKK